MEHNTKITTMSARGFAEMLRSVNLLGVDSKAGFIFAERDDGIVTHQQDKSASLNTITVSTPVEFGKKIRSLLNSEQDFSLEGSLVAVIKEENLQFISDCGINVANKSPKRIKFN